MSVIDDLIVKALAERVLAEVLPAVRAEMEAARAERPLADAETLARLLGVSEHTIYRAKTDGMPHLYVRDALRFDVVACRAWLAARPTKRKPRARHAAAPAAPAAGVVLKMRRRAG